MNFGQAIEALKKQQKSSKKRLEWQGNVCVLRSGWQF